MRSTNYFFTIEHLKLKIKEVLNIRPDYVNTNLYVKKNKLTIIPIKQVSIIMLKKFEYDCNNEDAFGIRFGRKMHIWNPDYI